MQHADLIETVIVLGAGLIFFATLYILILRKERNEKKQNRK